MVTELATQLRGSDRNLDPSLALRKSVSSLAGVSATAVAALKDLRIETVFDLAASHLFGDAVRLVEAASSSGSQFARVGAVPLELLDHDARPASLEQLQKLQDQPIEILRQLTPERARKLTAGLGVETIRDLALWPPYHAARAILNAALGGTDAVGSDPERPLDLLPATGRYPTERVQYEVLLLERLLPTPADMMEPTDIRSGPIDIAAAAAPSAGFQQVATGALLTFTQSWYTLGLSLGHLLHALALAPGESTRIAVVDWQRQTRALTSEAIAESEALAHTLAHNRSIAEVTTAVAREMQSGESTAMGAGAALSLGLGGGGAGGGQYGGFQFGFAGGHSAGLSAGGGVARSWASSAGSRDIAAQMTQQITDATHQASNLTRNRRATAIREVSQTEREQLVTRAVTNFNHMHALTVQYYEIVQLYRTVLELARVTRCLFIPVTLVDFSSSAILNRFRGIIAAAGLTAQVRALSSAEPDMLALRAPNKHLPWDQNTLLYFERMFKRTVGHASLPELVFPLRFTVDGLFFNEDVPFESVILQDRSGEEITVPLEHRTEQDIDRLGWHRVFFSKVWGQHPLTPDKPDRFWDLVSIRLRKKAGQEDFAGEVKVGLLLTKIMYPNEAIVHEMEGSGFLYVPARSSAGEPETMVLELTRTPSTPELQRHLEDNALYYSQAIWRSLDAATLGYLLASYKFRDQPLIEVVDPLPVAVAGNYLVFRTYVEDDDWQSFLKKRHLTPEELRARQPQETIVPLPSGGVFAEAVLGRSNAAEKLDITRFWNWQDSPIPIQAPEIAALQAGSRAQPEPLEPGQLSAPVLNIVNPPALPDPQGMAAVLAAIQNGNMFRDMSGLAATIGFAQAAMERGFAGAEAAAAQAGQNAKTAAEVLSALYGGRGAAGQSGQSPNTISNAGARINKGADLDQRGVGRDGRSAIGGDSTDPDGAGSAVHDETGSHELDAFRSEVGDGLPGPYGTVLRAIANTLMGQSGVAVEPRLPDAHPTLGDKAELLAGEPITIEAYDKFQDDVWTWWFSTNGTLSTATPKPAKLDTWADWEGLHPKNWRARQVILNLAGLARAKKADLAQLKQAWSKWPAGRYAVFQSSMGEQDPTDTNTCNLFLGDALTLDGRARVRADGKYYSAQQVYQGSGGFREVPLFYVQRGDIAAWGAHLEIVTSVDHAAGTFCSRGAGRSDRHGRAVDTGLEKCADARRQLGLPGLRFMRVTAR